MRFSRHFPSRERVGIRQIGIFRVWATVIDLGVIEWVMNGVRAVHGRVSAKYLVGARLGHSYASTVMPALNQGHRKVDEAVIFLLTANSGGERLTR